MPANIVGVAAGGSAVAVSDDTVLDVDGCSDIFSLSNRFPSDSTGTSNGDGLTSDVEGNRVIPTPNCDWSTSLRILYNFLYRNQTRWKRKTVRSVKYFWCRRRGCIRQRQMFEEQDSLNRLQMELVQ